MRQQIKRANEVKTSRRSMSKNEINDQFLKLFYAYTYECIVQI